MNIVHETYRAVRAEHPEWDTVDKLAEAVCAGLPRRGLIELVRPLIRDEVRRMMRVETRRVEQQVARSTSPDAYEMLTGESFVTPDGVWIRWEYASAEQHRQRAGWLTDQANELMGTAAVHVEAAERIERAGVSCLADLESVHA